MEKIEFQKRFPTYGDVFQDEHGVITGYTRKTVEVTGTAGQQLLIGDFIVLASAVAETGTIPADIAAIKAAPTLAIYAGNEAYQNMNTDNPSYNHNVTDFVAGRLKQKVVVVYRGMTNVAGGSVKGTTKWFTGLKFPAGTSKADIKAVHNKLELQGIHILRQVS